MGSFSEDNPEAVAFILVIAAGLCTGLGASVVYFPALASLANKQFLAMALGLAAGVMLYISLVDIYGKSIEGYAEAHTMDDPDAEPVKEGTGGVIEQVPDEGWAFILATITYFCGCILMLLLDKGVDMLIAWTARRGGRQDQVIADFYGSTPGEGDAAADLDKLREDFMNKDANVRASDAGLEPPKVDSLLDAEEGGLAVAAGDEAPLQHMSWTMFLAIAIHNFPEGMVTYIAYVDEPAVGVALAIGIAIHNIPEGLCVAMPMFYATGRRTYSFVMGTLSGLTEVIGGLIAWLILGADLGGNANGALFGLVAGMMTVISIQELLPTAHKYADNPNTVTYAFLVGAFIIALSLMLFGG